MDVEYSGTTPLWGRDVSRPGKRRHVGALQKGSGWGKARSCPRTPKKTRRKPIASRTADWYRCAMNWPHAPAHWLFEPGIYMVTAGTYRKEPFFHAPERLGFVMEALFGVAGEFGWTLRAWAVMSNHYHFVASSPTEPATLGKMLGKLHMTTAKQINEWDAQPGRKVWQQFWDSRITFETSYLARLRYVHENPVHHGIVDHADNYRWCSAAWFAHTASKAFVKTVQGFKVDQIRVPDEF